MPVFLVFKVLKGIITDESDISGALITKSIGSGKTKVLDLKQMKVLDYINHNLQTIKVETSIKRCHSTDSQKQDRIYSRYRQ